MCRDRFAGQGQRSVHVLDLLFGEDYDARALRRGPALTQRSAQRELLRERLLAGVWREGAVAGAAWREELVLAPEVEELLEERFVRPEEVHQVIVLAQATGRRFVDPSTGHLLASRTIGAVTYWAEYVPEGDRFRVLSAYSHRIELKPPPWPPAQGDLESDDGREWRCAADDHALEPRSVTLSYLVAGFPVKLLTCPEHELVLIPEALALGRMREVELALEDK